MLTQQTEMEGGVAHYYGYFSKTRDVDEVTGTDNRQESLKSTFRATVRPQGDQEECKVCISPCTYLLAAAFNWHPSMVPTG